MKIGLIVACNSEIKEHLKYFDKLKTIKVRGMEFLKGRYAGHKIYICQSGPSEINAGIHLQAMIDNFGVDLVINSGTCGGFDKNLKVCDTFVIEKATFWDISTFVIDIITYNCDENLKNFALSLDKNLLKGNLGTGNTFISEQNLKDRLIEEFNVNCCDMEGAAVVYTCQKNNIPCLLLKSVSDDGNEADFELNVSKASAKVAEYAFKCIENIKK